MALNFQIPTAKKNKGLATISSGFGLNTPSSILPPLPPVILGDLPEGVSLFGTPYYGSVFFEKPYYGVPEYDEEAKDYKTAAVVLAANRIIGGTEGCFIQDCIIDVNSTNNIVRTDIMGENGTIKEYINQGDAQVTIRGFFASPLQDRFPEINTRMLRSYLIAPVSLNITNAFLNDVFGITSVAIESFNFFQQQGMRNVQYFQINAINDTVVEIKELSK